MSFLEETNCTFKKKQITELSALVIRDFPRKKLLMDLFKINNSRQRAYIYNRLFFDVFVHDTGHHWIYFFLFHFLNLLNIKYDNLSNMAKKIKPFWYRIKKNHNKTAG
jgi:hypothetical protein